MFVIDYIVNLGASVMMPIIFTILGLILGVLTLLAMLWNRKKIGKDAK